MTDIDVAIVGAGPTGLALAGELALAGVSCAVFERRAEEPNLTRAFAVHARTLELLDARGLADRLLPRGVRVNERVARARARPSTSGSSRPLPQLLIVPQSGTELLLEERARELGVPDPTRSARSSTWSRTATRCGCSCRARTGRRP